MKGRVIPLKFGHRQRRGAVKCGKGHNMQNENVVVHECDRRVSRSEANKPGRPELSRPISNSRSKCKQFTQLVHVRLILTGCRSRPEPVAIFADDTMWWIIAPGNAKNENMPALNRDC